jgi:phosphoketolase
MTSSKLGAIFEATNRQFAWPIDIEDEHIGSAGRVLEILSEHTCQGWLQGYLLTGRQGFRNSKHAAITITIKMATVARRQKACQRPDVECFGHSSLYCRMLPRDCGMIVQLAFTICD